MRGTNPEAGRSRGAPFLFGALDQLICFNGPQVELKSTAHARGIAARSRNICNGIRVSLRNPARESCRPLPLSPASPSQVPSHLSSWPPLHSSSDCKKPFAPDSAPALPRLQSRTRLVAGCCPLFLNLSVSPSCSQRSPRRVARAPHNSPGRCGPSRLRRGRTSVRMPSPETSLQADSSNTCARNSRVPSCLLCGTPLRDNHRNIPLTTIHVHTPRPDHRARLFASSASQKQIP